ncbi:MAG: Flp pilus assembly complex ATPase component TadA [Polyangiaceae bacterium]|nr:Flp pilus assembly complex ATPase component TadA [Polyangiaceae bacterium]
MRHLRQRRPLLRRRHSPKGKCRWPGSGRPPWPGTWGTLAVPADEPAAEWDVPPHSELTLPLLCDVLEREGLLSPEQRREALLHEERERLLILHRRVGSGRRGAGTQAAEKVHPAEVLAALGLSIGGDARYPLTEQLVMEAFARAVNVPYVHLDPLKIDVKLAVQTLSRPFARRHQAVVIEGDEAAVTVAVANPLDVELVENLKSFVRRQVRLVVAPPSDIQRVITDIYGFRTSVVAAEREFTAGVDIGNLERYVRLKQVEDIEATDSHVVNAVEYLFHYAFDQRASDVHIEPHRDQSVVRMRIDGVLHAVNTLPKIVHPAVVSRIKMLARLDIAEKRRPQDGRIKTASGDREVEIRVSTMSVAFGEKVVLRIFDPEVILQSLSDIGLYAEQLATVEGFISRPHGLLLVTGPTGSGKTTTLYSALRAVAAPEVNVTTIEDPIEIVVDQFNQVEVQPKIGLTFPEALRHLLRQDPDVIMVGEVRDAETANIAVQASLTGHLVLATLHTNDSVSAVTRLLDLGVDAFLLASTLTGVIAQRLVRLVCPGCRVETFLTPDQMSLLGIDTQDLLAQGESPQLMVAVGDGCVKCRHTGLFGRSGVFEVLAIDDKLRKLVSTRAGAKDLLRQARQDGLVTLRDAAVRKLAKGLTSFEEVLRVTVEDR